MYTHNNNTLSIIHCSLCSPRGSPTDCLYLVLSQRSRVRERERNTHPLLENFFFSFRVCTARRFLPLLPYFLNFYAPLLYTDTLSPRPLFFSPLLFPLVHISPLLCTAKSLFFFLLFRDLDRRALLGFMVLWRFLSWRIYVWSFFLFYFCTRLCILVVYKIISDAVYELLMEDDRRYINIRIPVRLVVGIVSSRWHIGIFFSFYFFLNFNLYVYDSLSACVIIHELEYATNMKTNILLNKHWEIYIEWTVIEKL